MIQRSLEIASNIAIVAFGTLISLREVDFAQTESSLIMALSTHCHFCAESIPFYKRVLDRNQELSKFHTVAVFTQDSDEPAPYLRDKGLEVNEIVTADLDALHTTGTPTLILVDRNGAVIRSWIGKLTPNAESEVMSQLFAGE
jgi:thioredoxin-related protein